MLAAFTSDTHYGYGQNTHIIHEKFWAQLASHKPDVLFHAGDWSSYKQEQFHKTLVMARRHLPHIPILTVRGNHEIWDTTLKVLRASQNPTMDDANRDRIRAARRYTKRYPQIMQDHQKWFQETGIIHLDGTHYDLTPEIVVIGFDGWYHVTDPRERGTNDDVAICSMIESAPAMVYLREKAYKDLDKILSHPTEGKTVVGMTHMPPGRPSADSGLDISFWDDYLKDRVVDLAKSSKPTSSLRHLDWETDPMTQAQGVIEAYLAREKLFDAWTQEALKEILTSNCPEWNANPKYLEFLAEKCDYLLYGHTHSKCDRLYKGCRIMNCGGDYDKPKYTLFEL
jgi:predicted phosphodiesterase